MAPREVGQFVALREIKILTDQAMRHDLAREARGDRGTTGDRAIRLEDRTPSVLEYVNV